MEWIILIAAIFGGYFIYAQYQNSPKKMSERKARYADHLYGTHKHEVLEATSRVEKDLNKKDKFIYKMQKDTIDNN